MISKTFAGITGSDFYATLGTNDITIKKFDKINNCNFFTIEYLKFAILNSLIQVLLTKKITSAFIVIHETLLVEKLQEEGELPL